MYIFAYIFLHICISHVYINVQIHIFIRMIDRVIHVFDSFFFHFDTCNPFPPSLPSLTVATLHHSSAHAQVSFASRLSLHTVFRGFPFLLFNPNQSQRTTSSSRYVDIVCSPKRISREKSSNRNIIRKEGLMLL